MYISDASKHFVSKLASKITGSSQVMSLYTYEWKDENNQLLEVYQAEDLNAHPPDKWNKVKMLITYIITFLFQSSLKFNKFFLKKKLKVYSL